MPSYRYIKVLLGCLAMLCLSSVALSFYSNPYEAQSIFSPGQPPSYFGGTRTSKAIQIIEGDYDAFILGSSRSEIGISPNHPAWGELKVYNASLAGSNFVEIFKVFETIIKYKKPKLIVLSLDYSLFSPNRTTSSDFALSRLDNANNSISSFFKERLSKESVEKSFRALKYSKQNRPSKHLLGQKIGHLTFEKKIRKTGQHKLFFNTLNKKVITNTETYSSAGFSKERIQLFQRLIKLCSEKQIQLITFISPIHALQLETLYHLEYWEHFSDWKHQLTNSLINYPSTRLYDFTNWSSYITEPIPNPEDKSTMRWYWETSHYKQELGHEILDVLFNKNILQDSGFGVQLMANNIEKELTRQSKRRKTYAGNNPKLIHHIKQLMALQNRDKR